MGDDNPMEQEVAAMVGRVMASVTAAMTALDKLDACLAEFNPNEARHREEWPMLWEAIDGIRASQEIMRR